MGQAKYQRDGDPKTSGPGFGLTIHPDALDIPRSWHSPRTIFVNSMSDLFHHDVPESYIREVFRVITDTPQHQYQVLTKRSKRLAEVGHSPRLACEPLDGRERREAPSTGSDSTIYGGSTLPSGSSAPNRCSDRLLT